MAGAAAYRWPTYALIIHGLSVEALPLPGLVPVKGGLLVCLPHPFILPAFKGNVGMKCLGR